MTPRRTTPTAGGCWIPSVRGGSGANAGYYQEIALAQPGVTLAQAVPRAGGAGTVTVYLWGEGAAPSGEIIAAVQAELEAQREIGVTVTVTAAQVLNLPIPVKVKLPSEVELHLGHRPECSRPSPPILTPWASGRPTC